MMDFQYVYWGVAVALIVSSVFSGFSKKIKTLLGIIAAIFCLLSFLSWPVFLGSEAWFDRSPWKQLLLFLLMIAGMVCRTVSQAIELRREIPASTRAGAPLSIDKWDLVYPFLVSFLTFGAIMAQIGSQIISLPALVFAFQNGFFWQTLIGRPLPKADPGA
jgi:hypothetical protein